MRNPASDRRWNGEPDDVLDCAIVGGGPAGLTAGIYLSRFLRRCAVIDAGSGRAASIPQSHNLPGFPDGVAGSEILARLEEQLRRYRGTLLRGTVDRLDVNGQEFAISCAPNIYRARTVVLATGVVNRRPDMPEAMHAIAVSRGLIRYCPICDGFEARGTAIAVLGADRHGAAEALFLRNYGADVTLLAARSLDLEPSQLKQLGDVGIEVVSEPIGSVRLDDEYITVVWGDGRARQFGTLYPALGTDPQTDLAKNLRLSHSDKGCLETGDHQETAIPGLFAIGDVVEGLDQICVAMGQAAIAATAIHNFLSGRAVDAQGSQDPSTVSDRAHSVSNAPSSTGAGHANAG